ncbi:sodium P-type ATPase-like protein [Calycina marina]|uniref:P-type Na(+) transporter n=1 Tax=Calycina marina TaxID=1763456 RepID=A0A9P7YVF1_9HELO|nr:sodium P-type ATPase-like protein [Calycina marina]
MVAGNGKKEEGTAHVSGQGNEPLSGLPHTLTIEQISREIGSNLEDGFTAAEAKARLEKYGKNELDDGPGISLMKILIRQVANAMTLVLILAMAVSFGIGSYIEGGVISAVIALNITVGFFQEYSAEKTMNSLRSLSSPTASVVRDGDTVVVPTGELVYGDLVEVKVGDTVPADIRLVQAMNFETDEALLTGESLPVQKEANTTFRADTGPGDRLNVIFSSSTVTKGRGRGIIFATGMTTEIGSIAAALRGEETRRRRVKRKPDGSAKPHRYAEAAALTMTDFVATFLGINVGTPLQRKLSKLAILLFGIAVVCAIIVLGANKFSNNTEVVIYAVATGLSMIPASLIVVLTITMAAGTKRMVKRHVVVRKLDSLEALGGVTDICSDKTGTLTQGKMVVKKAWIPGKGTYAVGTSDNPIDPTIGDLSHSETAPREESVERESSEKNTAASNFEDLLMDNNDLEQFLNIASLANLAHVHKSENEWKARGDPTDIAIQVFASRFNWNRSRWTGDDNPIWTQKAEYPFDSSIKKMSVIFESADHAMVLTKGAVERIFESCSHICGINGSVELTEEIRGQILENMEALASQGLRVLALASKELSQRVDELKIPERAEIETDLVFRGLVGLYDPPRPETAGAVAACHASGIAVHMLTGDHPSTARAIALQVGILPSKMAAIAQDKVEGMVLTAGQFDRLSDDEIDAMPLLPLVIARCSPSTKVRMIEALHRRERFAAMTGDGVNDSPSLKRADVGIAMGLAGSDVAKDAADIVLTDDNFASILNAVEEGRRMFDNIQKFILHLLAENIAQACTLLIGLAFKDKSSLSVFPLAPVEILWVIMITSGMPDMGLGFEAPAPDIMSRPPHPLKVGVFTREVLIDMVVYGLWMAALCLSAFSLVMFGFGDGNLGSGCNDSYSAECDTVFRARATTFVCLTWFALFLAWEMVNMHRSFFRMQPGSKKYFTQWAIDVWRNQFLFWAIVAGFVTVFPTLYIPVINHVVFKHTGISWEWGIVFVEAILFFAGVEAWKWSKRIHYRRTMKKNGGAVEDLEKKAFTMYFDEAK